MPNRPDMRELLAQWPYDPEDDTRLVEGADGRLVMQVRLPLGIEQYELEGRPDGQQPYGMESALAYQLRRLEKARARGEAGEFKLNAEECAELFSEGVLYYYRYLHLFQLGDWQRTVRDTSRNVGLFDFVARFARREEDRQHLEQWRPYLIRMNAVARAMLALDAKDHAAARQAVHEGITRIEGLSDLENPTFQYERQRSIEVMRATLEQIEKSRPMSELELLERQLHQAVESEQFEKAAELRDRIKVLRIHPA